MIQKTLHTAALLLLTALSFAQGVLNERTLMQFGRVSEPRVSPDGKYAIYGVRHPDVVANNTYNEIYIQSTAPGSKPELLLDRTWNAVSAKFTPDGKRVGFLSAKGGSMQLWECPLTGKDGKQITRDLEGLNGFVYSPDGKYLVFFKDVQIIKAPKDTYADLPKTTGRVYDELNYRHWDTWEDGYYSHIFVAEYASPDKSKDIMANEQYDAPNPPDAGEEDLAISPDGSTMVYSCKKLFGTAYMKSTNTDLYAYDFKKGTTTNLTSGNKGYDSQPAFSPDGTRLAWLSMKEDGYESDKNRLMVMDWSKRKAEDITEKYDQTINFFIWATDSKQIYAVPTVEGTKPVYVFDVQAKTQKPLTEGYWDYAALSAGPGVLLGAKMSLSQPQDLYLISEVNGKETPFANVNKSILDTLKMGQVEKVWVNSHDKKKIMTWVVYPPNYDPAKKYPTLLYCQGGPQSPVSQFFSFRWNMQMMAAHGYIVVAPNRRGLPGFGKAWNDEIRNDYGGKPMKDLLSVSDYFSGQPYVDKNKMGAVGASFGGYSVYWLAGNHKKRFKCFIAHCGMFNMESWYGSTEEMFFANHDAGPYWDNKKQYEKNSPHRMVKNWDTPILIIHNEKDYRVPVTQGLEAFTAAQMRGVKSRLLSFPDENHFVSKPQNSMLWQREFFRWLDAYLK